ncbi:2-isopropylmalate synthase LeuA [Gottschalkia purinilytica]|uniref:2-isopropylmalate synthase n=1 Tax=Gottschalkia purinilytica TaxID=1503 RepID=A0A0L0WEV4_GOTPU|nr:2-isopropylmalate synthase [Gottschalkia purinilytica]KNF09999.1 2-isopropylmalate synthase LeuA [Gottschalkia purinilytica]
MSKKIKIFDTTLRDGEQSPGCTMNLKEKLVLAKQLEALNVDIIESGFAIASPGDFESVKTIAQNIKNCTVASLARALPKDIDRAWEALQYASNPRIHTFIATSDIHMKYKLRMSPEEVLERAVSMVKYAKKYCSDIEFSAEDASRTNLDFLCKVVEEVIKAGATVVNIPDTVGYTTPDEFFKIINHLKLNVPNIDKIDISVHCHNDLGMAVANSLAAVRAGATQVECTINGIGERAGNAALEEVVMGLNTRKDFFNADTNIITKEITKSSRLLTSITGVGVQPNKAIVGANAFAHESGIHQHGMLAERSTYEIMTPESVGLSTNKMVLGKHSGRHAFEDRLKTLGFNLSKEDLDAAFEQFKILVDKKKTVYDKDLEAIITKESISIPQIYSLKNFVINSGSSITATASVALLNEDKLTEEVATGDGPIDASYNAINKIVNIPFVLEDYSLGSVTEGEDSQGEAVVKINKDGKSFTGRGLNTDVIASSIEAYLDAINKMISEITNE